MDRDIELEVSNSGGGFWGEKFKYTYDRSFERARKGIRMGLK